MTVPPNNHASDSAIQDRPARKITEIDQLIASLPDSERQRVERIFRVVKSVGTITAPESMHDWLKRYFGSVGAVERQRIIRTRNVISREGTLFNELRALRPIEIGVPEGLQAIIERDVGDPFCRPLEGTPSDVFGRVQGRRSITASNVAKFDAMHAVIIFDEHDPFAFSRELFADVWHVGHRWAQKAFEHDPEACYPFFMWNCMWRSGASLVHGHAQVTCTRESHYDKVEQLRDAAETYGQAYGINYFDDLVAAHRSLGLMLERGPVSVLASLTPIKEKEVWLISDRYTEMLSNLTYDVLETFKTKLGVTSFNLVAYGRPLRPVPEDWSEFPFIARIVDRGSVTTQSCDFGAMELYASSVVATDPYRVIEALEAGLGTA